jgi:REP element-mobilizing transposase RayT
MNSEESASGSRERKRVEKGHLPRLAPEWYRGRAFVHWTLTTENRATGWLTPAFHQHWQFILLHTCHRYSLACAAYILMPDHTHTLWLGLDDSGSDQRVAIEFFRKQVRPALSPADWQRQPHDHVLDEAERKHGSFQTVAHYILENPVRAGLVVRWRDYPYVGCCVPGYPDLDVRREDYWELFWRIYNRLVEPT